MTKLLLSLCTLSLLLAGCDGLPALTGTGPKHRLTVIPSAAPKQRFEVTIQTKRYLSDVARQLGTTVEAIIADNGLPDSSIAPGQRLKVRCTERRFNEFKRLQRVREERRLKRAEKRRLRKLAKEDELLKRKKNRQRVRRKRARRKHRRRGRKRRHKVRR